MPHAVRRAHPLATLVRRSAFAVLLSCTGLLLSCTKGETTTQGDSAAASSPASVGTDSAGADGTATSRSVSLPVSVAVVSDGDLILSVTTTGQVRSDGEATLKAEVAGTLLQSLVRPGDRVKRGQVLMQLDPRPFDLAVQEAEAAVSEAEVRYQDYVAPDSIVLGRPPSAEQRRIALARSGLQIVRVRLDRAKLERERATIVAPFDGMVDRVDRTVGERVGAGETLTRVVNLAALRIEASVLEHDLPLIKEGGTATITSASVPDRAVTGRVSAVLPLIDSTTRAGRVYVRLTNPGALRPGMYADVRLESQRLSKRRLVPSDAVIERDGRPLVFVVKAERAQWIYINPGRNNGTYTEVLADSGTGIVPVEVGDQVIVSGHLTLTHDAPVRAVTADATKGARPVRQ